MAKPILWAKMSAGTLLIEDLGLILNSSERELTVEYGYSELSDSTDLYDAIGTTNLVFSLTSGGTALTDAEVQAILQTFTQENHDSLDSGNPHNVEPSDLDADDLVTQINTSNNDIADNVIPDSITRDTELTSAISTHASSSDHDGRYFTETELSVSGGGGAVHWDNVTNKPAFGGGQYQPVHSRVLGINEASAPVGTQGDFYIDNQASPHLWWFNSSSWVDQGIVATGERYIDLSVSAENIFEYDGASFIDQGAPESAYEVTLEDDGDGKQAGYVYDIGTTSWIKRFDIDIDGTKTLDGAYQDSPSGNKFIDVNDGEVDYNQTDAYSPIVFNEKTVKPTNDPDAGKTGMLYIDGVYYMWDTDRSKWLSVERKTIVFAFPKGNNKSKYLLNGSTPSLKAGERLVRDAVLLEIAVDSDTNHTADYDVRKKSAPSTTVDSLTVTTAIGGQKINSDVNFSAGDVPIVYMDVPSGKVNYPVCTLTFAYLK